jgi:hypothetical protein
MLFLLRYADWLPWKALVVGLIIRMEAAKRRDKPINRFTTQMTEAFGIRPSRCFPGGPGVANLVHARGESHKIQFSRCCPGGPGIVTPARRAGWCEPAVAGGRRLVASPPADDPAGRVL